MIRKLQGAHGMVITQLHRHIDILRAGHALLEHTHGYESQRNAKSARSKTGHIPHNNGFLPQPATHFANNRHCIIAGRFTDYNFNQAHEVNRIEEMHADYVLRMFRSLGDFSYR